MNGNLRFLIRLAVMMKLLVTGGSGFIGSAFLRLAVRTRPEWEFVCLDAETYASDTNRLTEVMGSINYVVGDVRDDALVRTLVQGVDFVLNFAAETHNDNSLLRPNDFISANILGASVLMTACVDAGVAFHQVSTDEIYGDLPIDGERKFELTSPLSPSSPYSASKAAADLMVGAWRRSFGLDASISICCNNYGPFQHREKLIPKTISLAKQGLRPKVFGTGENVREWIHVDDHASALLEVIQMPVRPERVHIGSGVTRSNLEVVRTVLAEMGMAPDYLEFIEDRQGHDRRYQLDLSDSFDLLDWRPTRLDFDQELRELVRLEVRE